VRPGPLTGGAVQCLTTISMGVSHSSLVWIVRCRPTLAPTRRARGRWSRRSIPFSRAARPRAPARHAAPIRPRAPTRAVVAVVVVLVVLVVLAVLAVVLVAAAVVEAVVEALHP